jgi:hypothetical protein
MVAFFDDDQAWLAGVPETGPAPIARDEDAYQIV